MNLLSYKHIKLKLRLFWRGCSVAIVTLYVKEIIENFDTVFKQAKEKLW